MKVEFTGQIFDIKREYVYDATQVPESASGPRYLRPNPGKGWFFVQRSDRLATYPLLPLHRNNSSPPLPFVSRFPRQKPDPVPNRFMDPSAAAAAAAEDQVFRRASIIARHLRDPAGGMPSASPLLVPAACLHYAPPEASEKAVFDSREMRRLMDGHDVEPRDWLFRVMEESLLFCPRRRGGEKAFVTPDYNQTKEQQREATMRRIEYLLGRGVFEGWLTGWGPEVELRKLAFLECLGIYDHSLSVKLGVHFFLW